jgi:microcystin-dependent protein
MEAYIGEIRAYPYMFAPVDWAYANGAQIFIQQNSVLYAVIGAYFGGDKKTYYNLPDLVNRVALGTGQGPGLTPRSIGDSDGDVEVQATTVPPHTHTLFAETSNSTAVPSTGLTGTPSTTTVLGKAGTAPVPPAKGIFVYNSATPDVFMSTQSIGVGGNTTPAVHANTQPTQVIPYLICTSGNFPVRPS